MGLLTDLPALGLAGAVVAAVPAILAARHVPALHADLDRCRAEQAAAPVALAPAEVAPVLEAAPEPAETAPVRPFVTAAAPAPQTVDLAAAEAAPAPREVVDLVKAPTPAEPAVPSQAPAKHLVRHASVAAGRVTPSGSTASAADQDAPTTDRTIDPRVDTAELQRIWDLGEAAARTRSGRGRRVRVGAEVDALPDRPRNIAGHRRRARHRA